MDGRTGGGLKGRKTERMARWDNDGHTEERRDDWMNG